MRRGRLSILRHRMKNEFSGMIPNIFPCSVDDDAASTSDNTSLASWGRNLLMDCSSANIGPFFPADSLSTKAFSMQKSPKRHESNSYLNSISSVHLLIFFASFI